MNRLLLPSLGALLVLSMFVPTVWAAPQVVQDPMGPDGDSLGFSVSPSGEHVAVLANKGSHLEILYDNVPGPVIDAVQYSVSASSPFRQSTFLAGEIPVIFSDDSAHWAYMARTGDSYVVMRDGREIARGPLAGTMAAWMPLTFSAKGQHLFYSNLEGANSYHIVVDAVAGPAARMLPSVVFSADGTHYAYVGEYTNAGVGVWSFVDGHKTDYFGDHLQYTGRGVLMSTLAANGATELLLSGKPQIKAVNINPMWISPDGAEVGIVITPNSTTPSFLSVNGKTVEGTQGLTIEKMYFSPDGKRWAALCAKKTGSKFMIVDGQKGNDYAVIPANLPISDNLQHWRAMLDDANPSDFSAFQLPVPGFTADSSKFVYVTQAASRAFMIIDGAESDGFQTNYPLVPVLCPSGNHIALLGASPTGKQRVLVDGAEVNYGTPTTVGVGLGVSQLTFSPGGAHHAFIVGSTLFLDGVAQPGQINRSNNTYVFSPDGKHIAYTANSSGHPCLIVDGKDICDKPGAVTRVFFSADSKHVYWLSQGNWAALNTKDNCMLFVDGVQAAHFMPPTNGTQIRKHFSADGVLSFFAVTDGAIKRIKVASDTTLAAVVTAAPAAKIN